MLICVNIHEIVQAIILQLEISYYIISFHNVQNLH